MTTRGASWTTWARFSPTFAKPNKPTGDIRAVGQWAAALLAAADTLGVYD
jgi:hypothetical protein